MASKEEGSATNRPPYFYGCNYTFWKAQMGFLLDL